MPSVPSIDHQRTATVFRSFELSHLRDVLSDIIVRLREVLKGEEALPDVTLFAALLARVQLAGTRLLLAADKAHEDELANDFGLRQRRDETGEGLYKKMVEVRRILTGLFGPERTVEVLGVPGHTAPVADGERLWRQAIDVVKRLEDPGFILPEATSGSFQLDVAGLAAEIRGASSAFRQALDAVALERRKAEATLKTKNARIAEAERLDAACRRFYEGFFLLADRADLVDRFGRALRLTRRSSSTATSEPDPGAPGPAAPSQEGESSEPSRNGESSEDGDPLRDGEPGPAAPVESPTPDP